MAVPKYFKRLFREYVTGEGSSDVAAQAPLQSSSDVTVEDTSTDGADGTVPTVQNDGTLAMQASSASLGWQEDANSPFSGTDVDGLTAQLNTTTADEYHIGVKKFRGTGEGSQGDYFIRVNNKTSNYRNVDTNNSTSAGAPYWKVVEANPLSGINGIFRLYNTEDRVGGILGIQSELFVDAPLTPILDHGSNIGTENPSQITLNHAGDDSLTIEFEVYHRSL